MTTMATHCHCSMRTIRDGELPPYGKIKHYCFEPYHNNAATDDALQQTTTRPVVFFTRNLRCQYLQRLIAATPYRGLDWQVVMLSNKDKVVRQLSIQLRRYVQGSG